MGGPLRVCGSGWRRGVCSVILYQEATVEMSKLPYRKSLFRRTGRQFSCHSHPLIASREFVSFRGDRYMWKLRA